MGAVKERLIVEHDQGWSFVDGAFACESCVEEPFLKKWIQRNGNEHACSYCHLHSQEALRAVAVNDLFDFINGGLRAEYGDALDLYLYDSEDKEYVGHWSDSNELAYDLELFGNDGLHSEFADAFRDRMFCPSDPFSLSEDEAFISGWERFVAHVKHKTRYYFLSDPTAQPDNDYWSRDEISVSEIPTYLGQAVRDLGLVREVGPDAVFFRARLSNRGEAYHRAAELGTVPVSCATAANRMSPAGIPMFYGAVDNVTAIAEVYDASKDEGRKAKASIGAFRPSRSLRLLDLTGRIPLPSLFDPTRRQLRGKVRLLRDFAKAIAQPIEKDRFEHIDYAPTQIVTEYFRHVFSAQEASPIDGIMYASSRNPDHACYVLFVDDKHCVDAKDSRDDEELRLRLASDEVQAVGPDLASFLDQGLCAG